ncbi:hypothetical protein C8034_v011383 [Colletotrichum sidae]|uniref:Uncharacterized protein n=1 Tax=Colletotrichum sidae TaxID=1347389 RepID=A0A4R8TJH6_9PEZI|nr:hypothetical protein C8034_v011383 [Colletotrichum sidae]
MLQTSLDKVRITDSDGNTRIQRCCVRFDNVKDHLCGGIQRSSGAADETFKLSAADKNRDDGYWLAQDCSLLHVLLQQQAQEALKLEIKSLHFLQSICHVFGVANGDELVEEPRGLSSSPEGPDAMDRP